ncbi:MAG: hypothetical protein R3C26_15310 [Calditrichia bacterium]
MRVKICGITRLADAELATELGADAWDLFLRKSPRQYLVCGCCKNYRKIADGYFRKIGVF